MRSTYTWHILKKNFKGKKKSYKAFILGEHKEKRKLAGSSVDPKHKKDGLLQQMVYYLKRIKAPAVI